jgi:TetR/AcrR family transcriptional repressor of nem operon
MARTNTREEIIHKGAELIHAQGFNATGLQQILQTVGIPKGSFYFYFKSKEDFGLEIINYFNSTISGVLANYLGDKKIPPIERVEKLFEFFETVYQNNGYTLGCPIGNLSLELADTNERLRAHLDSVIESLIAQIESCLQEAQLDKSIPANLNTADVARFIFYGFEGALLHMKVVKNMEPFRIFRDCLKKYLIYTKASETR